MTTRRAALAGFLLAACTAAATPEPARGTTEVPAAEAGAKRTWRAVMTDVERHIEALDHCLLSTRPGDLRAASTDAIDAAGLLRLGYGPHECTAVPGFAGMAREAESWLLQIAIEARQSHGELAADLFRTGRARHCTHCHDAVERATR